MSYDERVRAIYPGGRADATARRLSRLWAAVFGLGLAPRRWVALEVTGRRWAGSPGSRSEWPTGTASWYLVPMLGERSNWVQNVRAADGQATLRHGRARRCLLIEVPVSERGPILRRYLDRVPGGRSHIPVSRDAPLAAFDAIAPRYPVFRVTPAPGA